MERLFGISTEKHQFKLTESLSVSIHREPYLGHKYERHTEEATEDDRERDEGKSGVLLAGDDQDDRSRDEAQHHDVVDAHADVA